jgi:hypothetical protein
MVRIGIETGAGIEPGTGAGIEKVLRRRMGRPKNFEN